MSINPQNESIQWTEGFTSDFIDKYKNIISWWEITSNPRIVWNQQLLEKYEDEESFNWYALSKNKYINWSVDLIKRYAERWFWQVLSSNEGLPWSKDLVDNFNDYWDWDILSENEKIPWKNDIFEKYFDLLNWELLLRNRSIIWSEQQLQGIQIKLNMPDFDIVNIQDFNNNINIIDEYLSKFGWLSLVENNKIPPLFSLKLLNDYGILEYSHSNNWALLSRNKRMKWSLEIIQQYEYKWDWKELSANTCLPWSEELVAKFENRWNWEILSANEKIPWSFELIEKNNEKLEWGEKGLSANKRIPWTIELLELFDEQFNWYYLAENEALWKNVFCQRLDDNSIEWILQNRFSYRWAGFFR